MDNFESSLAKYLGRDPISNQTLLAVQEVAYAPDVLPDNIRRLRAIYTRFVGVDLTPEQAHQKMAARVSIDCCHPIFSDSPHLIPLMIAARDTKTYVTEAGLVGFTFIGPRHDGFPISTLLLRALKGASDRRKDIDHVIYKKGCSLDANMIEIDKLVARVFPRDHYNEPEEREVYPPISALRDMVKGPFTHVMVDLTWSRRKVEQPLLPGFERYASMGRPGRKRAGGNKGLDPAPTKHIDLHI